MPTELLSPEEKRKAYLEDCACLADPWSRCGMVFMLQWNFVASVINNKLLCRHSDILYWWPLNTDMWLRSLSGNRRRLATMGCLVGASGLVESARCFWGPALAVLLQPRISFLLSSHSGNVSAHTPR